MIKADLEKSYLETTYSVFVDEEKYDIKIGKALPSALQQLVSKGKAAAILTAWNPKSQAFSSSENESRNIELESRIKNYIVYKTVGRGTDSLWPEEESFFIINITKREADTLAVDFEQNAYVWLEHKQQASLIFTELW